MTSKDWIIISLISAGLFLITRKLLSSEETINPDIPKELKNPTRFFPLIPNSDELRVMQYADIMMSEGKKQGMDPAIIAGVMRRESSGIATTITPETIKVNNKIVKTNAYGLMQMLLETANERKFLHPELKYNLNPTNLLEPDVNIQICTSYLVDQLKRYTKNPVYTARKVYVTQYNPAPTPLAVQDMIASYNAGSVRIEGDLTGGWYYTNSVGDPKVQGYVDDVLSYKNRFRQMFKYLYADYDNLFPTTVWGN